MDINLIAYGCTGTSFEQHPTITQIVGLENIQVCYFDRYRTQLEQAAKACNATEIVVFEKQYKFSAKIENGKIGILK